MLTNLEEYYRAFGCEGQRSSTVVVGTLVPRNAPSNSLAVGNPVRVLRQIQTGLYGTIFSPLAGENRQFERVRIDR